MDLGFSRRDRNRDGRCQDADRLRSLLAEVAMRQGMTATARMQNAPDKASALSQPAATLGHFAPAADLRRPAAAFHPDVAASIVNGNKDS